MRDSESVELLKHKTAQQGEELTDTSNEEMEKLLNDALNDFNVSSTSLFQNPDSMSIKIPSSLTQEVGGGELSSEQTDNSVIDQILLGYLWKENNMKEAMSQFEDSLKSTFSSIQTDNSTDEENNLSVDNLLKDFRKMAEITAKTVLEDSSSSGNLPDSEVSKQNVNNIGKVSNTGELNDEFGNKVEKVNESTTNNNKKLHDIVTQTIKNLANNLEFLEDSANITNNNSDDLKELLNSFIKNDKSTLQLNLFMESIQLSIYQLFKELRDKYPPYLKANEKKLSEKDFFNYNKQYEVMNKVCQQYEQNEVDDQNRTDMNPDILYEKLRSILPIMQEIQKYGDPPEELTQVDYRRIHDDVSYYIYNQIASDPEV